LGFALVGWIVIARLAWIHPESDHDYRRQVRLLTVAETTARTELEQLRRQAGGSLAALQARITAAQSTVAQVEQSRAAAQARLAEVEQNLNAHRRSMSEAETAVAVQRVREPEGQVQLTNEGLTCARANLAFADQAAPERTQELAEVGLEQAREQEATLREERGLSREMTTTATEFAQTEQRVLKAIDAETSAQSSVAASSREGDPNEEEGAVRKLAEATATAELVQRVCFLRTRETRIDELTAKANVSKQDLEPGGRYGALLAAVREQVHTSLASTRKGMSRKQFCEYVWHAYGAYGERFVRRPR
jgi:hypothetical protein